MQDFLDKDLPQDLDKCKAERDKEAEKVRQLRRDVEKAATARFRKNSDKQTSKEKSLRKKLEDARSKHERLQEQERFLQAGTKVVSRLEATGRARQLQSDEEHALGVRAPPRFRTCRCSCTLCAHPT